MVSYKEVMLFVSEQARDYDGLSMFSVSKIAAL